MAAVKRLLDEAELPWGVQPPSRERATLAHIIRAHETGPQVANVLLEQDAELIVHAVNNLPDYEAAVDALEALTRTESLSVDETFDRIARGHEALDRLRPRVPA